MRAALVGAVCLVGGCSAPDPAGSPPVSPELLVEGAVGSPSVSPDGAWVAFDVVHEGTSDIRLVSVDGTEARTILSGRANDRRPSWSPSGDSIAFVSDRLGHQGIWVAAAKGGESRLLFDAGAGSVSAPEWSPDGTKVAFSHLDPSRPGNVSYGRATVFAVTVSNGETQELTRGGDEWWPTWTRDGKGLVYYVGKTDDVEVVDLGTGDVRRLWGGRMVGWRPDHSPVRDEVAFISDMDSWGLFTAGLEDGAVPTAHVRWGQPDAPEYLPDGSGLLFTMDTASTHVVRLDLERAQQDTIIIGGHTAQPLRDGGFAYLPDGPRGHEIMVRRRDALESIRLPIGPIFHFALSPDETTLGFTAPTPGNARHDLYVMGLGGGAPRKLTDAGDVLSFVWCDSESLLITSSTDKRANERRRLWSVDVETGGWHPVPIEFEANQWPNDCTSGRERIALDLRLGASGMFVATLIDGEYDVEPMGRGRGGRWSRDGTRLAYTEQRDGRTDVFVREPDGTVARVTDDDAVEANVRWTSDGSVLLFDRRTPARGIWLLRFP